MSVQQQESYGRLASQLHHRYFTHSLTEGVFAKSWEALDLGGVYVDVERLSVGGKIPGGRTGGGGEGNQPHLFITNIISYANILTNGW